MASGVPGASFPGGTGAQLTSPRPSPHPMSTDTQGANRTKFLSQVPTANPGILYPRGYHACRWQVLLEASLSPRELR